MTYLLILDLAAKSAGILLLAFGVHSFWRGASAAQRSLVWLASFLCLFALPLTGLVKPLWTFVREVEIVTVSPLPMEASEFTSPTPSPAGSLAAVSPPAARWPRPSPLQAAVGVWAAGALLLLAHWGLGSWRLRRLRKNSAPCADPEILRQVADLREALGVRRPVEVRISPVLPVPVTWGVLRPVILIPERSEAWTEGAITAALLHELGHIRHLDAAGRALASLCCALHWPNPLVWLAARAWRADQERAADDLVLRGGIPAQDYAWQLLDAARAFRSRGTMRAPVLAMARPATLERRLTAIMDGRRNRHQVGRRARCIATGLGLLVFGGTLSLRVQGEPVRVEQAAPAGAEPFIGIEVSLLKLTPAKMTEARQLLKDRKMAPADENVFMRRFLRDEEIKVTRYPQMGTKNACEVQFRSVVSDAKAKVTDGLELAVLPQLVEMGIRVRTRITKTVAGVKEERTETEDIPEDGAMALIQEGTNEIILVKASRLHSTGQVILAASQADAGESNSVLIRSRLIKLPKSAVLEEFRQGGGLVHVLSGPKAKDFEEALRSTAGMKLLSSPTITTRSGKQATVESLIDVPVPGKESLRAGPVLSFLPHFREGNIELFADLLFNEKIGQEDGHPILSSRALKTSTRLNKGQTALFLFAAEPGQSELVCLVSAESVATQAATVPDARQMATQIILPRVQFAGASMDEAVEFLRVKSRSSGAPGAENLNITIRGKVPPATLTLDLIEVPLSEALRYVAELSSLEVTYERNSIVLLAPLGGAPASVAAPKQTAVSPPSAAKQKVASIILPSVQFRGATFDEAVEFLRVKSRQLDPEKKGVNIVAPAGLTAVKLTLDLKSVPLSKALHYVAQLSNLDVHFIESGVILTRRDDSQPALPSPSQTAASRAVDKAEAIIVPSVVFSGATLTEAVEYLRMKGRELAPDKQGVNIIISDVSQAAKPDITCDLRQTSLLNALQLAAGAAEFIIQADDDALLLVPVKK